MSAATVERFTIRIPRYEVSGPPSAPAVVVLGGISATRHVCANDIDPSPGWWDAIAGAGKSIDSRRYRIISFDFVDGGGAHDGRPGHNVTTHDQASALESVLDQLGVDRVHCVVGASYGGMVSLAFAERSPDRVSAQIVIGAAHQSHPMTTAIRSLQRQIVELGIDTGRPREALALARALAMTSYRTANEFASRFATEPVSVTNHDAEFPVESYLRHHGERFAATWSTARFLALSLSADLHRVDPARITTPTLVVAAEGDSIVRPDQSEMLALTLPNAAFTTLHSRHGHDAFLTDTRALGAIIANSLTRGPLT
jgi:homoserine O-acetyltransferase